MRGKIQKIINKTVQIIGSKYFFWGIIGLFVLQAMWIALSFRYPMLFDEHYHFGLIEYFSHQWLPWINNQSTNLDVYGALGRNPYLLYHYLMSFPFRIVALFTNNLAMQVISMRLINIGLFAGGLTVFAHLFKAMKIQPVFRNTALLFFVLLPVVPLIAATINYDNAIFLITALFMLTGLKIMLNSTVQWRQYAWFLMIGMAGALMKSAFVPILVGGIIFITIWSFKTNRREIFNRLLKSFRASNKWFGVFVIFLLMLTSFLFIERFGVNVIKYHNLSPSCMSQMSKDRCLANPIEVRNADFARKKAGIPLQLLQYSTTWIHNIIYTLSYTGSSTTTVVGSVTARPLPVIYMVVFVGAIVSFVVFFYGFRILNRLPGFWLSIVIMSVYLIALYYINASAYYKYYVAAGIQGRYLLPVLLGVMMFALLGVNSAMQKKRLLKVSVFVVVFALSLNGAGVITHIVRSNDSWIWDNQTVRQMNDDARDWLSPYVQKWWYDK